MRKTKNKIQKLLMLCMCTCLLLQCTIMSVSAAVAGRISITVPEATAGEVVTVKVNTVVDAGVTTLKFDVNYDPNLLEFVSAQNTEEVNEGKLTYSNAINRNSLYSGHLAEFTFKTLEPGNAKIEIANYDIKSYTAITWTADSKTLVIKGDGSDTVADTSNEPEETTPTEEETVTEDEIVNSETDEEKETDVAGKIYISETVYISPIKTKPTVTFPERYVETTITIGEDEYPAWQDSQHTDKYIMYANSSESGTNLYSYDSLEKTYQRFELDLSKPVEEPETVESKGLSFWLIVGLGGAAFILFIVVVCLGAKNGKLKDEIDDLEEANEDLKKNLRVAKANAARKKEKEKQKEIEADNWLEEDIEAVVEKSLKESFKNEEDYEVQFIDLDS